MQLTEDEIKRKLRKMQKENRYRHTLGVMHEAERLAAMVGADTKKARLAGLLHDCAKNMDEKCGVSLFELAKRYCVTLDKYASQEKALVHAFLGAAVARRDYGVEDEEVLSAIYYHTTGRASMTLLEKVVYLADVTETGRNLQMAAVARKIVETDFEGALIYSMGCSIRHVIDKGGIIHPDSVHALNYLIESRRAQN